MTNAVDDDIDECLKEDESPSEDNGPPDSEDDAPVLPVRALFEGTCVHCEKAIKRGDLVAWASGPEKYGAYHVDCQKVNQEPPGDRTVSLDEPAPMPAGDTESMSREVSALHPAIQEVKAPTPWRSSIQVVAEEGPGIVWLIPGLLPAAAVVLVSGREGSMKSWVALSLARAVAAGVPWLGMPTKQGAVLYLDGEMPRVVLKDRLQGIGAVQDLNIWGWTDAAFPQGLGDATLIQASKAHTLIIVDTLRRQMTGLKENSADDMASITAALRELTRYGATVLVLHHSPKDIEKSGYRGSSELGAGVDMAISLTKKKSGSTERLTLESPKTRYSSSEKFEIRVIKGERAPVFSMDNPTQDDGKQAFDALRAVIVDLQGLGNDPTQHQIIAEACRRGLGGKDKIRGLLKEGEAKYWRSVRTGKRITYTVIVV